MQMNYSRWERRDGITREELGYATIEFCRAQRSFNRKVTGSRYFWIDAGNTVAVLIEGEPGFADFDADPAESLTAAQFRMNDVARQLVSELWTDARLGQQAYERAGQPSGVVGRGCRACGGTGMMASTDVGGGGEIGVCPVCGGTGHAP